MVEGLVDLIEALGLGDEPSCLQTDLSIRPIVPLSLGYRVQILLECFLWHRFELPIGLPYFLTFGNKFGIKYFT